MRTNDVLIGRDIDTVDLVSRNVALQPLNLGSESIQNTARFLRNSEHLIGAHISDANELSLNNVLGHVSAFPVNKSGRRAREPASPVALFVCATHMVVPVDEWAERTMAPSPDVKFEERNRYAVTVRRIDVIHKVTLNLWG